MPLLTKRQTDRFALESIGKLEFSRSFGRQIADKPVPTYIYSKSINP